MLIRERDQKGGKGRGRLRKERQERRKTGEERGREGEGGERAADRKRGKKKDGR